MTELKKTIEGLDCCIGHGKPAPRLGNEPRDCKNCPYARINGINNMLCFRHLQCDALKLLKAAYPEPHCLTLEELRKVEPGTVLWREIYGDEPTVYEFSGTEKFWEINTDIYGESFRLWTAKPNDEQRKAVKWNE